MTFKTLCAAAFAAFVALTATATLSASQETKPLKFRLISWSSVIEGLHFRQGDGTLVAVPLILPNGRSPYYTYQGAGPVVFGRVSNGPDGKPLLDEAGNPIFHPAAHLEAAKFSEKTLLMFHEQAGASDRYQIMPLDDSEAALPPGSYRFFNFTPYSLAVQCGDAQGTVASRDSVLLRGKPTDSPVMIRVVMAAEVGNQLRRAFADRWPYIKTHRTSVFVYYLPNEQMFEVKQIAEDEKSFRRGDPPPAPPPGSLASR